VDGVLLIQSAPSLVRRDRFDRAFIGIVVPNQEAPGQGRSFRRLPLWHLPRVHFAVPRSEVVKLSVGAAITVALPSNDRRAPGTVVKVADDPESASEMIYVTAALNLVASPSECIGAGRVVYVFLAAHARRRNDG
jgi:hypothetical protein